jgi:hypothetical protein
MPETIVPAHRRQSRAAFKVLTRLGTIPGIMALAGEFGRQPKRS